MKGKNHTLVLCSWIHDMLLFEGIYVLIASIRDVKGEEVKIFLMKGFFMLLPIILSYIMISKCQNLLVFLVFSLALTWGMKVVSKSGLTGGLTAFVCLFRCYARLKQGEIRRKLKELPNEAGAQESKELWEVPTLLDVPRIPHCLLLVMMYLGVIYFRRYELLGPMSCILAAELCVCLAYCYLERLEGFVKKNLYVANLPADAMKRTGIGILLIGITGYIICMLPAAIYHEEPLSKLRFELGGGGEAVEYYEENTETNYIMEELMKIKAQAKETPEWLEKASELVSVLTVIGISCLAVKMVFIAIRRAMESFSEDGEDEIIFLREEEDDQGGKKSLLKRREKESFRSPDRKIRRLYKRLIKSSLREKVRGNEAPLELENKAGLYEKEKGGISIIHELYEKARYGKEKCTKEEVKQYVDIFSEFHKGV